MDYNIFPTFIVRTPLLPFEFLENLLSSTNQKDFLKEVVQQKLINEALFLATPEFYTEVQKWIAGYTFSEREENRILQTLYKYLSRMATRCTPFGLFAGSTTGVMADKTRIVLSDNDLHSRHTRLDMLYLCDLASLLAKDDKIKEKIKYFPNSTIYKSGEHLRYIECIFIKEKRKYKLVQIKNSKFIKKILKEARRGATIKMLSESINNLGVPYNKSKQFIVNLINSQVLVSELEPSLTGDEFLTKIYNILIQISDSYKIRKCIEAINNKLYKLDTQTNNNPIKYIEISKISNALKAEYNLKYLFQVDVSLKTIEASIDQNLVPSIMQGIKVINILTEKNSETTLEKFKKAFIGRYEDREVPLLNALDNETGIGYFQDSANFGADISPLVDDLILPAQFDGNSIVTMSPVQNFLLSKYLESTKKGNNEVEIYDSDIKEFSANWSDLPVTFSLFASLIEGPSEKYPFGRLMFRGAGNSSAVNLIGRFCHSNEKIHQFSKQIISFEKQYFHDSILAEIVHLPEARLGNVILRPVLREYEIPILTTPSVKSNKVICLSDLFISVKANEVILSSKKLKKKIIPRLSNSHNYSFNSLPVYQFLCDLQKQKLRSEIGFSWGNIFNNYSFRPRVIYKNLILYSATWIIKNNEIHSIQMNNDKELLKSIEELRIKRNLPTKVIYEERDNHLFIDLTNALSVRSLLALVKNMTFFTLKEFLFNINPIVKSPIGIFNNEIIFSFYKKN